MPTRYLRYRCSETGRACFLDDKGQNYWCPYHGDHKVEREQEDIEVPSETDVVEQVEGDDDDDEVEGDND